MVPENLDDGLEVQRSAGECGSRAQVLRSSIPASRRRGKKGILDDGHRGWKKYGNKAIQNANFCRYAIADELENFPQVLKISSALVYYTSSWIS
ncbi:unnamed protein product [Sphagnum balticum]